MAKLPPPSRSANHRGLSSPGSQARGPASRTRRDPSLPGFQADKNANCNHFIAPIAINGSVSIYALVGDLTIGKAARFRIICAMRIYVLALDGVFDLGLSAILDAFQTANELIEMTD
jgi:hypothetical protein